MKQYSNRKYLILMLWALIFPTLAIHAQKRGEYDLGKPFGWAVSGSLEGGCYNLNGGEGGKSITLKSDGGEQRSFCHW